MPFAPYGMLFCSCHDVSFPTLRRESTNTTVAYCCLLFFFNFFQYVKELY
jgi:hypothetical protein